ncbi:MAG TPA: fasciclin domain-containing protein, partial [Candidatus Limnocylindria bacterium]|nr:fasciclin domain-containing protein [Candidatus Limnocylindria bacterium]
EQLLAKNGLMADDLLGHPRLSEILLYHVVPAELPSSALENGMTAATLNGRKVMVDMTGEGTRINTSTVTEADMGASNGVIHAVDKVLVPANVRVKAEPQPAYKPLARHDRGPEVLAMKDRFFELGGYYRTNNYDDLFKPHTVRMVKLFEEANGLPVDGIADAEMLRVLFSKDARQP